jgi:hypothetical protein
MTDTKKTSVAERLREEAPFSGAREPVRRLMLECADLIDELSAAQISSIAAEREACAKIAEANRCPSHAYCGEEIAAAIRARGTP